MKAIIPAGGMATRMLPISRAVPKEMLPIGSKPVIHYIIEELQQAGITEILILIGHGREGLIKYLENFDITYKLVPVPRGPADNINHAKSWVGNDNFIVAYCDNVFFDGNPTTELLNACAPSVLATSVDNPQHYGVIHNNKITEKPSNPKSNLVACGRYYLTPKFFDIFKHDKCMTVCLNELGFETITTKSKCFDTGTPYGLFQTNNFIVQKF